MASIYKGLIAKYNDKFYMAVKRGPNSIELISNYHNFKGNKNTATIMKDYVQELFVVGYYADYYGYKCTIEGIEGKRIIIGTVFDNEDRILKNLGFKEIRDGYCGKRVEIDDCGRVYIERFPITGYPFKSERVVQFNTISELLENIQENRS